MQGFIGHIEDFIRRYRDHRQVRMFREVADGRVCAHPVHRTGLVVHRVDGAAEVAAQDAAENQAAYR